MAQHLRETFAAKEQLNAPAFVTFLTAGFPSVDATVPLMLAMERGGSDVIELGVPFTDPLADGKAIQDCNNIALDQGVDYTRCLEFVKEARAQGLKTPVILMGKFPLACSHILSSTLTPSLPETGYFNPLLAHGEERAVQDAKAAGANGFIIVDLPPEEAVGFRKICTREGLSYVPLIAPSTTDNRIKFLASIADSFIYVVSKMGTTGASDKVSSSLSSMLARIRKLIGKPIPLAVGFGVSTQEHFEEVGRDADGVVIGSQLVSVIKDANALGTSAAASAVEAYCQRVSGNRTRAAPLPKQTVSDEDKVKEVESVQEKVASAARFGDFGGAYVPEALYDALEELTTAYADARADPKFWEEWNSHMGYINRPSQIYEAKRLSEQCGGARIWFKREDLNHTGSHKINNAIGQILLARRLGKTRIIAETGAGQHGVATATACAKFGLECIVYMGEED
ncbi:tryptophan synthetase, partial [Rhodotorula mucilaginosa]